ncbi:MAG TPA: hypothetical protein VGJ90_06980 [Methylophilaceae bacterium]|jgi:truncated hemoglobin YjbI
MTERHINPNRNQSIYAELGGVTAIQQLVKVIYGRVEIKPEVELLLSLHLRVNGLAHARVEQFNFLSGFLGGPKLYNVNPSTSGPRPIKQDSFSDSPNRCILTTAKSNCVIIVYL